MKKYMVVLPASLIVLMVSLPQGEANAQIAVLEVIKAGVKKVIRAVDLQVQRLQNETIWLQNAQKTLENQLSKLKLNEIAEWTNKQRELYGKYYTELWQIKSKIAYYHRIKEMIQTQEDILQEYKKAWSIIKNDKHFNDDELKYIESVYSGILDASVKNLDQILLVINSYKVQMTDAERLEIISEASDKIDENYSDLKQFNYHNAILAIQRSKSANELETLKKLYEVD